MSVLSMASEPCRQWPVCDCRHTRNIGSPPAAPFRLLVSYLLSPVMFKGIYEVCKKSLTLKTAFSTDCTAPIRTLVSIRMFNEQKFIFIHTSDVRGEVHGTRETQTSEIGLDI